MPLPIIPAIKVLVIFNRAFSKESLHIMPSFFHNFFTLAFCWAFLPLVATRPHPFGVTCLIGYGQRGQTSELSVEWERKCPNTRYCWEGTTNDISKVKMLYQWEWDSFYTTFYVRGCGGDLGTPIQDPWKFAAIPPMTKQINKPDSLRPKYINLTMPMQVTGQGGYVQLKLEYTCREDLCDEAKIKIIPVCFAGTETVQTENGNFIEMSELKVGDRILTAKQKKNGLSLYGGSEYWSFDYSKVIALPHPKNALPTVFIHIITSNPESEIKLTPDHLILASKVCNHLEYSLVPASSVRIGYCLKHLSGDVRVLDVRETKGLGIYSAVVQDQDALLVVSGVVASSFAMNHQYTNSFYNILRVLDWFSPRLLDFMSVSSILEDLSFSMSSFLY